ncbi:hypothetical protein PsAD13_03884 [Pseudovibrio sp. Ad13]|nr:hypothetical protein PsAD13_03884 [Pseudovibrio sp. Ad13]
MITFLETQKATDTFTYTVDDGHGGVVTKNVTVTITDLPNPISISHVEALPKIIETGVFGKYDTELSHNGSTLAITEGDLIVVGSNRGYATSSNGAVYVLVPDGNGGRETIQLTASGSGIANGFGGAVAANKYGTIIIGADDLDNGGWSAHGAVLTFSIRMQKVSTLSMSFLLIREMGVFGHLVAINDAGVAVVGTTTSHNEDWQEIHTFYVYTPTEDSGYAETQLSSPLPGHANHFGWNVEINANGTIAVSAPYDDELAENSGAVYIYQPNGAGGYTETEITPSDGGLHQNFGDELALNDNGTIVIGAENSSGNSNQSGAVYVYALNDDGQYEEIKLIDEDGKRYDYIGHSVANNNDGVIVVGVWRVDTEDQWNRKGYESGAIYIYRPDSNGVYTVQKLTEPYSKLRSRW